MTFDRDGRLVMFGDYSSSGRVLASSNLCAFQLLFTIPERPSGIAADSSNRIITISRAGTVRIHDANGATVSDPLVTGLGAGPVPMAVGNGGCWEHQLYAIAPSTHELVEIIIEPHPVRNIGDVVPIGHGFDSVYPDMAFGPDGAIYISDFYNERVLRIPPHPVGIGPDRLKPARFGVLAPVPNPVGSDGCRFEYVLDEPAQAEFGIYDSSGRRLVTLFRGWSPAGQQAIAWNGKDSRGNRVAPGIYFARLRESSRADSKKIVITP